MGKRQRNRLRAKGWRKNGDEPMASWKYRRPKSYDRHLRKLAADARPAEIIRED